MASLLRTLALVPLLFACCFSSRIIDNEQQVSFKLEGAQTNFKGSWKLHRDNTGVSAMHLQLMPNSSKAIWYDVINLGQSAIENDPKYCRGLGDNKYDCFAHGIEYDIDTAAIRTLKFDLNPWCSSGGLTPNGDLLSTGGNDAGGNTVRILSGCQDCQFREQQNALSANRWYATNHILANGDYAVVGGRNAHNLEIVPSNELKFSQRQIGIEMLLDAEDEKENNLYPFVFLAPDGKLFVFANSKSVLVDIKTEEVKNFPDLPGGSRNYPASGMSALLPIKLSAQDPTNIDAEVIVCGGNTYDAFKYSENEPRKFFPALKDCSRISITKEGSQWDKEDMPSPRVMGDMLLLPTGDILILNGAKTGTSGWNAAEEPNLVPLLYSPDKKKGERFTELTPSTIPRMYHSSAAVLPDGQIFVGGSNTNPEYLIDAKYPTELRVEKFEPPYLAPELQKYRPIIAEDKSDKFLGYGQKFKLEIKLEEQVDQKEIMVTMYSPPFTTHGFSQNQRLLILGLTEVTNTQITALSPPSGKVAPPGYYMVFVVNRGVPSRAMWVHIK